MSGHQRPSFSSLAVSVAGFPWLFPLALARKPDYTPTLSLFLSFSLFSRRLETRRWGRQEVYRPYLYPCMVPIKREPLTAFVSDTVAVPAETRETGDRGAGGALVVVIGHQVLYPCRRGDGRNTRRRVARGRSNDTGYRVFHKDSMKIARDFITGEMSVNKNEYTDSKRQRKVGEKRERERQKEKASERTRKSGRKRGGARRAVLFIRPSCSSSSSWILPSSALAPLDSRRFESAISRLVRVNSAVRSKPRLKKARRLLFTARATRRVYLFPSSSS